MVHQLKTNGLYDSTRIIIEAKHGQSPIDPTKLAKIGHAETKVLTNAGINLAQVTDDDVALIWLADQSQTAAAVAALNASKTAGNPANIDQVLSGDQITKLYQNPLTDSRTPDIVVLPTPGTIYSSSKAKVAEHGGFSPDDTHVALLVVNGEGEGGGTVSQHVSTTQIAPTILRTLGLDPQKLDAVRNEGTRALPGTGD
jgi:arylsulfatase A-like enzyme